MLVYSSVQDSGTMEPKGLYESPDMDMDPHHNLSSYETLQNCEETPKSSMEDLSPNGQRDWFSGNSECLDPSYVQIPSAKSLCKDFEPPGSDSIKEESNIRVNYSIPHNGSAITTGNAMRDTENIDQYDTTRANSQSPCGRLDNEQPLTWRYQLILKIASMVAAVMFFPTGIPAAYFSFKTTQKFNEGLLQGNIYTAQKYAQKAEKLILFSTLCFILVIILSVAFYEKLKWEKDSFGC